MTIVLITAVYATYAAFWVRFLMHALVWWKAVQRSSPEAPAPISVKACVLTMADAVLFARLFRVDPALWFAEWSFHSSLLLVLLRHLRYFLDPVPMWVWSMQTPGLIAGFILPLALLLILVIRLKRRKEQYSSKLNLFLLTLVLGISLIGLLMNLWFRPNLVDVKLFVLGFLGLSPSPVPEQGLFLVHFSMVLLLLPFLPTHVFTAPFVMMEARKRQQTLQQVMHDE
jgi:nitrate reductase gamma subunit